MKDRKQAGRYGWSGACTPGGIMISGQNTFSVGIFKWLPKASGKGIKCGPVIYRIKGSVRHPERVYKRAEFICEAMDRGIWQMDRKSETVKP